MLMILGGQNIQPLGVTLNMEPWILEFVQDVLLQHTQKLEISEDVKIEIFGLSFTVKMSLVSLIITHRTHRITTRTTRTARPGIKNCWVRINPYNHSFFRTMHHLVLYLNCMLHRAHPIYWYWYELYGSHVSLAVKNRPWCWHRSIVRENT